MSEVLLLEPCGWGFRKGVVGGEVSLANGGFDCPIVEYPTYCVLCTFS